MYESEHAVLCDTVLQAVSLQYDLLMTSVSVLKQSENTIMLCKTSDNTRYILRIDRPHYHTREELLAELIFMDTIRTETSVIVPKVIHNKNGNLITKFEAPNAYGEYYSVFSFVGGTALHDLNPQQLPAVMRQVGTLAASMHLIASSSERLQELTRFHWDLWDLIGPGARFGDWIRHPSLTKEQITQIDAALKKITARLERYGKTRQNYGLIHSDLHLDNILIDKGTLGLIDFDDCGYGWFLYECGCSLLQYSDDLEELLKAWAAGYEAVRKLSDADRAELWTFVLLRRIARIAWMNTHCASDTAKQTQNFQYYITVTVGLCRDYVSGTLPMI